MAARLAEEIRKRGAFESPEQEAFLNLLRTVDRLMGEVAELLKSADLSPAQYNALRILRGAGPDGLACGEVGERMIARDPDVTRLLDRLEKRGLVSRRRRKDDRRVVIATITPAGERAVAALDAPIAALHRRQLGHLGPRKLRLLVKLLETARARD